MQLRQFHAFIIRAPLASISTQSLDQPFGGGGGAVVVVDTMPPVGGRARPEGRW